MIDTKFFTDLAKKMADALPSGFKEMQGEFERNFREILQAGFAKLDLVTREEFDIQVAVLARTRAKLEALELKVAELEEKIK